MQNPTARIEIIDPLRGLAALSVAWFHFTNAGALFDNVWLRLSGAYGWLGVEIFFVISGFVIPYSLSQTKYRFPMDAVRFVSKRIIRLDPPYIVAIAFTIMLWYVSAAVPGFRGSPPHIEPVGLLLHLGYLNAFFGYPWVIPVLWTLAIEFQFYILIATCFPIIAHESSVVRILGIAALCGSAFVFPDGGYAFHYMALFALGIATFYKYVGIVSVRTYVLMVAPIFAAAVFSVGNAIAIAGLLTALVVAFARVPRIASLAFLGSISYSFYLVHIPVGGRVMNLGKRLALSSGENMVVLLIAFCASVIVAYLMHKLVEVPAQKWSSSLTYSR